jgi:predicted aspartyl protease
MRHWIAAILFAFAASVAHAGEGQDAAPQFAIRSSADQVGRVIAPVYVNGQGPFRFVVDTGANRTVIAPHLAARLAIEARGAPQQLVHGVTGAEAAPIVRIQEVRVGRFARRELDLPVLSNRLHAGVDGTLGADHLQDGRLVIDFEKDRIELSSAGLLPRQRHVIIPAQLRLGQLPLVSARIGPVPVRAVIDTGAERSLANGALRRALEAQRMRLEREGMTIMYGAVGPNTMAELIVAPSFNFGGLRVERLPILFGDTHFFRIWDLETQPAVLVGMDVLGQFDALIIDYRRREVAIRLPRTRRVA